jgi:catecholate siderophore receptor
MKNRTFAAASRNSAPRRRRRGQARLFVLGAAFLAAGPTAAGSAAAAPAVQQETRPSRAPEVRFHIQPGPLDVVITEFRRVTGVAVVFADPGLGMIQSPGVDGLFTVDQALGRLLTGTSVRYSVANGVVTLDVGGVTEFIAVTGEVPSASSPKYTEPLRDTPQTIVVIPQAVFKEQGATSLRDALRNTPGITLAAGEGGTAPGDNLLIRGFSARNDVYIDGARDPGVIARDTFNVEMVEVAKGPSSVTAGRGSTGGSVNLVTKSATLQDAAEMRLSGGTAEQKRGTIDLNRRVSQSVAFRLNGMWQDGGVAGRDEITQKAWGFAPSIGIGVGRPTSVTLSYQHLHQNNVPDHGLPSTLPDAAVAEGRTVDDIDFSNFYGLLGRDYEKVDSDVATATIDHRFGSGLSLRNLTRYGQNSLDRVVTSPRAATSANASTDPGYNPAVAQIRRTDTKYQYRDDRTITNQTDLTTSFETGGVEHSVVTGVEVARDRQPSYAATDLFTHGRPPVTDLFHPTPADLYVPAIAPTGASSTARALSAALYAFDTVKLNDHWQVDLGARWDRIDVDYTTVAATSGTIGEFGRVDRAVSGRSGVVYKPVARGTLYASYSTSFNPSYDGSFGLTLSASGANNAALPPERSRNVEVGTKWDVTPQVFVTAAVFKTDKTNAKTTDASGATILAGDQEVTGVEIGASGNLTPRWNVFTGLAVMDGTVKESAVAAEVGKRLSYVPKTSFNLWSTYRLPFDLTLGGGAQFTDGYFFNNTNALTTANQAAIQRLTKYWLFNAVATYDINRHLSLQMNASNLANHRYVERANQGHFIPGAGRAVVISPIVKF